MHEYPKEALNRLVNKLNGMNLNDLLTFNCLMSLIDYHETWQKDHNLFAPILNVESINLFSHALVLSRSANYKNKIMTFEDLFLFYRTWLDVIGFRQNYIEDFDDKGEGFNRQMLTMISTQMRYQSYDIVLRYPRAYGLLVETPNKNELLLRGKDKNYVDIPNSFLEKFDLTISEFVAIGLYIQGFYYYKLNGFFPEDKRKKMREYIANQKKNPFEGGDNYQVKGSLFIGIYKEVLLRKDYLFFKIDDLYNNDNHEIPKEKIQRYLELTSISKKNLSSIILENKAYEVGIILDRLNPLERYPIIKTENDRYIIPNFRYFEIAITELIHYMMQEKYPSNFYNQTRGFIQELYIARLLNDCFSSNFIIPETEYKKGKNFVLGPDLTVCDEKLIVIESKGKRLSARGRVDPTNENFIEEIGMMVETFKNIVNKIDDLYLGLPEYGNYQIELDITKRFPPIAVVIMGEGIPLLSEILQDHIIRNNISSMQSYPYPFLLLDLTTFETLLMIKYSSEQSLYEVLLKYSLNSPIKEIRPIYDKIHEELRSQKQKLYPPSHKLWEKPIMEIMGK